MWQIYKEILILENLKNLEVVSWNPVYLFWSKKDRRQSYNWRKTLMKTTTQSVNFPKKERKEYQEIKILAKPHGDDQKLLSKRLILSWPNNRTLEYMECDRVFFNIYFRIYNNVQKGVTYSWERICPNLAITKVSDDPWLTSDLSSSSLITIGFWKREFELVIGLGYKGNVGNYFFFNHPFSPTLKE